MSCQQVSSLNLRNLFLITIFWKNWKKTGAEHLENLLNRMIFSLKECWLSSFFLFTVQVIRKKTRIYLLKMEKNKNSYTD